MELSPAQRKIAFVVVVFVLAGLGIYLLTSSGNAASRSHDTSAGHPARHSAASVHSPATSPSTAPVTTPASSTSTSPSPSVSSQAPDIYQWLPFTSAGLARAAAVAVKFGDAYGTFSYTESTASYVATMSNLTTTQLAQQISEAYSAPGVAHLRTSRKQVSTGTAAVTSLRAFGPTSITFILSVTEHITATSGGGAQPASFAVTVTGNDTSWQVSSIELASMGNS